MRLAADGSMFTLTAILVVIGLFIAAFTPLALVATRMLGRTPAAILNAALILGVAGYQAGLVTPPDPRLRDIPTAEPGTILGAQCTELIAALDQGRVIVDRRSPPRLIVHRDRWSQLPEEARGIVLDCVQRAWPVGTAAPQLEMQAQ